MLSPPSIRWSPTATRRKPGPVGVSTTVIRLKSVVPPPMSQTRISSPARTSRLPAVLVRDDPAIERRLRLLQQRDRSPARAAWPPSSVSSRAASSNEAGTVRTTSCVSRRSPCVVLAGEPDVPGVADVPQVVGRRLDRRDLAAVGRASPGQDVGLAVDAGVAEPALGAGDEVGRAPSPPGSGRTRRRSGRRRLSRAVARRRGAARAGRAGRGTTAASAARPSRPARRVAGPSNSRCRPSAARAPSCRRTPPRSWSSPGRCRRCSANDAMRRVDPPSAFTALTRHRRN